MRYAGERELSAAYKSGARHGIWLLYGSESYLIDNWAARLTGSTQDASPFDYQRLDGSKPDLNALWDAVEAFPLMTREKRILLDGIGVLSTSELELLAEMLSGFPEDCVLVITARAPAFDADGAAGRKLIALVEESDAGAVAKLDARSQADLTRFLRAIAEKQGCTLSPELARYLTQACGMEMLLLQNELLKVCAYTGQGVITRERIDAIATRKLEARVFDLQKYIIAGNAGAAFELLATMRSLREQPVAIVGALVMSFCDLYRARTARNEGHTQGDFLAFPGYKGKRYRASRAWDACRRLDVYSLRRVVGLLFDCDLKIKSIGADDWILLEQTVVSLMLACAERRR